MPFNQAANCELLRRHAATLKAHPERQEGFAPLPANRGSPRWQDEGATLSTIRDILGRTSASVTDRYLRRLGAEEAVAFARQRDWGGIP